MGASAWSMSPWVGRNAKWRGVVRAPSSQQELAPLKRRGASIGRGEVQQQGNAARYTLLTREGDRRPSMGGMFRVESGIIAGCTTGRTDRGLGHDRRRVKCATCVRGDSCRPRTETGFKNGVSAAAEAHVLFTTPEQAGIGGLGGLLGARHSSRETSR